jgi:hypothetical protein
MPAKSYAMCGVAVMEYDDTGPMLDSALAASEIVGEALGAGAELVLLPSSRIGADFLRLRTGIAGEALQKFVNYRLRVAFIGDFASVGDELKALRDFIRECNEGRSIWFVACMEELRARLAACETR